MKVEVITNGSGQANHDAKEECVLPMVISSEFRMVYRDVDHPVGAPHFNEKMDGPEISK